MREARCRAGCQGRLSGSVRGLPHGVVGFGLQLDQLCDGPWRKVLCCQAVFAVIVGERGPGMLVTLSRAAIE